eukprot:Hpha_TRINITY_DN16156_c5_g1::TRINITY_DN16156_c5_g1_i1::g.3487::m.3487
MPVPLVVFAIKCSAGGGFVASVADFVKQVIEKKIIPEEDKRERISGKELIMSFAVGTVVGNIAGVATLSHARNIPFWKGVGAVSWAELVYAPLHVSLCCGKGDTLEDNVPRIFGYVVFIGAGSVILCDTLIVTKAMAPSALRTTRLVMDTIGTVTWSTVSSLLFIFTNKYADNQRNKTILHPTGAVTCIHTGATVAGQILGNLVAFDMAAIPWWSAPAWWVPSMVIFPAFVYCTCLNIEAGVKSREVSGRTEPTDERRGEAQTRVSIMQVLPLGALPSGFVKAHKSYVGLVVATKALAAMCACAYISYQQSPWEKYLRIEKGEYRRVERKGSDEKWGAVWEAKNGTLVLESVEDGSPVAGLEDLVGRELFMANDEKFESAEEFEAAFQNVNVLNLDFKKAPAANPALGMLSELSKKTSAPSHEEVAAHAEAEGIDET